MFLLLPKFAFAFPNIDPHNLIPKKILIEALSFYEKNNSLFPNKKFMSIINYGIPSQKKRFFIINLENGSVWSLHVAHGSGSDPKHKGIAAWFSNKPNSNASSLGFYKTTQVYEGKHGISLRLEGLSSTNSKAYERAIVLHGADYVKEADVIQGRSWGCPAIANQYRDSVIEKLKEGSLIYVTSSKQ